MADGWKLKLFGAIAAGTLALPSWALAGSSLARVSAMRTAMDGTVILLASGTSPSTNPTTIYDNTLKIPNGNNVVYVTISATGFGDGGGIAMECQIDGVDCMNGAGPAGGDGIGAAGSGFVGSIPPGWVIPYGNEFAAGTTTGFGATGLGYQWCATLPKSKKGIHDIKINAAPAFGAVQAEDEFLEAVQVFVDVNTIPAGKKGNPNACGTYTTPSSATSPDTRS